MATCQTTRWVSSSPYVRLTVTESSSTGGSATLSWVYEYYASSSAKTSVNKDYRVTIAGDVVATGQFNINGKTGWNTIASGTKVINKSTSAQTVSFSISFSFNLTWSGNYCGTKTASGSISVAEKTSYTISYNANGGSGAPSSQTKWYDTNITLSTTKPTRSGYTFQGWATSASGGVSYASGATYSGNANATLYAVWKAITYTISYNANGGTGAPSNQTKTHNSTLVLSSTKPTRANYNFKGWGTSAADTNVSYAAGADYTANTSATLYAVWELAYIEPIIYDYIAARCTEDGAELATGTWAIVEFSWETTYANPSLTISWDSTSAASGSVSNITLSGTSGTYSIKIGDGQLVVDASYKITVTITDSLDSNSATVTLGGSKFPIDFLPGGRGVGIGKPAELAGVADFALAAKFNGPVFGNVLGLGKLPEIPANSDLNDYMTTGCWAVYKNDIATTITNIPVNVAGRLEVYSATGEGIRPAQYSYLRQRYIPYNRSNAVWEREVTRGADNVWRYYDWWKSSLTSEASDRVYKTPTVLWSGAYYMSDTQTATFTGGKVSEQNNGIVLVFSQYTNNAAADSWWNSFFVPKDLVSRHKGTGQCFFMVGKASTSLDAVGMKYLYIHDDYIAGHATNDAAATGSGITYANNKFVLRYVIGV